MEHTTITTAEVRSPPEQNSSSQNTPWLRRAIGKLRPRPKQDNTTSVKVARVDSPTFELTDVENFRACVHHFKWTTPLPKQLYKCFTKQFARALMRNATAMNRSGQCFLAFVMHEAKKFFREKGVKTNRHTVERCLRMILEENVADALFYTIHREALKIGQDLARTQCLHDRPCPDWISSIAERVVFNRFMRPESREGLAVLLGVLDLHSTLRLSDEARRSFASGPWPDKHMKLARKMAKRRQARLLTAHPPSTSAPPTRHTFGRPNGDGNEDESSAIYNPDVARQHLQSAQSAKQPTGRIQVFRNGAPHALYATEVLLEDELRNLEKDLEDRRTHLKLPPGELPGSVPPKSTFSKSSKVSTCILDRVRATGRRIVHRLFRNKPRPQPASLPQPQSKRSKVRRHRGSWGRQRTALEQLETRIRDLQRRQKLVKDELKWLEDNRPRPAATATPTTAEALATAAVPATAAIPSREAAFRAWEREQARSSVSRTASQEATSSTEQARSSAATGVTSLDQPATSPDSIFGPFPSGHVSATIHPAYRQTQQLVPREAGRAPPRGRALPPDANRFTSLRRGPPRRPSQDRANVYREQNQALDGAAQHQEQLQEQEQSQPREQSQVQEQEQEQEQPQSQEQPQTQNEARPRFLRARQIVRHRMRNMYWLTSNGGTSRSRRAGRWWGRR